MAVKFSENVHFVLDNGEIYGAFVSEVKFVTRERRDGKGKFSIWDMKFEIFDPRDILCIEGKRDKESGKVIDTCVGKTVKASLWVNKDGGLPQASKNMIQLLAEVKGLDIEDEAFNLEDLKGAVCRLSVVNEADKADASKIYSKVDIGTIRKPTQELKQLCKLYKEAKAQKDSNDTSAITGTAKPKAEEKAVEEAVPEKKEVKKNIDETSDKKNNPFL